MYAFLYEFDIKTLNTLNLSMGISVPGAGAGILREETVLADNDDDDDDDDDNDDDDVDVMLCQALGPGYRGKKPS